MRGSRKRRRQQRGGGSEDAPGRTWPSQPWASDQVGRRAEDAGVTAAPNLMVPPLQVGSPFCARGPLPARPSCGAQCGGASCLRQGQEDNEEEEEEEEGEEGEEEEE
ncbi:unnamed protein product [Prorocentrum cordatum]|uniref:Uncharacterized protein n=1 Tax=Prorocentrum cordatum TaxID=2364126 RepID=A0ABN9Y5S0_9DINO|nr:unnamed protein product [Polarella glacialis]